MGSAHHVRHREINRTNLLNLTSGEVNAVVNLPNGDTDIQDLAFLLAAFGTTCTN